jgi:hypothetical protein
MQPPAPQDADPRETPKDDPRQQTDCPTHKQTDKPWEGNRKKIRSARTGKISISKNGKNPIPINLFRDKRENLHPSNHDLDHRTPSPWRLDSPRRFRNRQGMPALTRRRSTNLHLVTWHVYYGDVPVGMIGQRAGVPVDADQWQWSCGFYPGLEPGQHRHGIARHLLKRAPALRLTGISCCQRFPRMHSMNGDDIVRSGQRSLLNDREANGSTARSPAR